MPTISTVDVKDTGGTLALDGVGGFSWWEKVDEVGDGDDDTIPQSRRVFLVPC